MTSDQRLQKPLPQTFRVIEYCFDSQVVSQWDLQVTFQMLCGPMKNGSLGSVLSSLQCNVARTAWWWRLPKSPVTPARSLRQPDPPPLRLLPWTRRASMIKKTTDYITTLTSGKAVVNSRHDKLEDDPESRRHHYWRLTGENIDKGGIKNGGKMRKIPHSQKLG